MHHNFLFDLDQTLLDFHASEYIALDIVLRSNGLSFSDEIYRAFKACNKALWLEFEKGTITRTELFTRRFQDVFCRYGMDTARLDPLKINDDFIRTMSMNGVLMEGALEFVKKIKENIPNARIYIASNGVAANAKGRIVSTGLDQYIDDCFISDELGVAKPDAAFFAVCLDRIGEPKTIGRQAFKGIARKAVFRLKGTAKAKKSLKKALQKKRTGYVKSWKIR